MTTDPEITPEESALRAHDVVVSLERTSTHEYDLLVVVGLAARLALHLRGVQAIRYDQLRIVVHELLDFPATALRPVLRLLAEAEFVALDQEGATIKTVIPNIPYYDELFPALAEAGSVDSFSEPEKLTVDLLHRLAKTPMMKRQLYELGAERSLTDRILQIGEEGRFLVRHRARGQDIILSPTYFPESQTGFSDLVAGHGASRVAKLLELLRQTQGWPLSIIERDRELAGVALDDEDLKVLRLLAGEGFVPPPAIETPHAGTISFFLVPAPARQGCLQ